MSLSNADTLQIAEGAEMLRQARILEEKADDILSPICQSLVAAGDRGAIEDAMGMLPRGFNKTQLQVWLKENKPCNETAGR